MGLAVGSCSPPLPITRAQSQLLTSISLSDLDLARGREICHQSSQVLSLPAPASAFSADQLLHRG